MPVVSSEIESDPPILGPSDEAQHNPAAASNGSGYFVVWDDSRGGIFGTRVDPGGQVLDKTGIFVGPGSWDYPDVAFDGMSYVVTWGIGGTSPAAIAVRVKPDGTVLDNPPITIAAGGGGPRITRAVDGSLILWNEYLGSSLTLQARRLGQDGKLLGAAATKIASDASGHDAAFDGSVYLISWCTSGAVRAARLTSTGTLLDPVPITVASAQDAVPSVTVTAGVSGFVLSWRVGSSYPGQTKIARVAANGDVLDPGGIVIPGSKDRADIGFDGSWFMPVFMGAGTSVDDVFGIRFAPTGTFDATPFPISGGSDNQEAPRIASRPGEHLVVWPSAPVNGSADVSGRRVSGDGALLGSEQITLAYGANRQASPAVGSDGNDFLFVWQDHRGAEHPDLYAERIAADGTVLDAQGIPLMIATGGQEAPAIAFDGTSYVMVWHDRRSGGLDVYGARIGKSGQLLDPQGFLVASSPRWDAFPAIASNGTVSFVVWQESGYIIYKPPLKIHDSDLRGVRMSSDGTVLDTVPLVIADEPGEQGLPAVSSDGQDFLVVWGEDAEIRAARYGSDGTLLSSSPLIVASGPGARGGPRVAFGAGMYLVIWADTRNTPSSSSDSDIYAARVSPAGQVLDPNGIRVSDAPKTEAWADVTYAGGVFVVAWTTETAKRAARVDLSGSVLDTGGFDVSPDGGWGEKLRLTANGLGTTLIGYERYDDAPAYRSRRVKARSITFAPAPDASDVPDANDAALADAAFDASPSIDATIHDASDNTDATADGAIGSSDPREPGGGCGCRAPRSDPRRSSLGLLAIAVAIACVRRRM